jgi:hypothetical protein
MKKITTSITITLFSFLLLSQPVFAQSVSPSATKTLNDKLNKQINQLKEKIASRVSELNLVEKRGIIGNVTEVSGNKITIKDVLGDIRFIDVDELTKFSSTEKATSFGLSDLTKGTKISVIGLYNKQSKRLLGRFIRTSVDPVVIQGTISSSNKADYQITITDAKQKQTVIDISTTTKMLTLTKDNELTKLGFSQIATGTRAMAIGYPDKKDPNLLVASRVLNLPTLPTNPEISVAPQASSAAKKTDN